MVIADVVIFWTFLNFILTYNEHSAYRRDVTELIGDLHASIMYNCRLGFSRPIRCCRTASHITYTFCPAWVCLPPYINHPWVSLHCPTVSYTASFCRRHAAVVCNYQAWAAAGRSVLWLLLTGSPVRCKFLSVSDVLLKDQFSHARSVAELQLHVVILKFVIFNFTPSVRCEKSLTLTAETTWRIFE